MTQRIIDIASATLDQLDEWDVPMNEVILHAALNKRIYPEVLISELTDTLKFCETERWIVGVRNPLKGTRWALTDKGRAQRHS